LEWMPITLRADRVSQSMRLLFRASHVGGTAQAESAVRIISIKRVRLLRRGVGYRLSGAHSGDPRLKDGRMFSSTVS
jgi:hypothetical protein